MAQTSRPYPCQLNTWLRLWLPIALSITALAFVCVSIVHAATIVVQSAADDGTASAANCPGSGCRLRDAIAAASPGDTITFGGDYTITLASELRISKTLTIDGTGHSVTVSGNNAVRVFYVNAGVTFNLQNLTVANGRCTGFPYSGGGIYNNSSSLMLSNVIFSGNSGGEGGGLYVSSGSSKLTNVTFISNSVSNSGGGMYSLSSSPTLSNVTFSGNSAGYGGGMFAFGGSPVLTNVVLEGNSATYRGGGMFNDGNSNPMLTSVTFKGNTATDWGGGIFNDNNSSPTLINVTLSGNSASSAAGMYSFWGSPTLTNVTFKGNLATYSGGGIYNNSSSPVLTNVTFSDNSVGADGGGIYNYGNSSRPRLISVTFSGNTAAYGGGIINRFGSLTLTNTRFISNMATAAGGGIYHIHAGSARVVNSLFLHNRSGGDGAALALSLTPTGTVQILHTTIADTDLNASSAIYIRSYNSNPPDITSTVGISDSIIVNHAIGIQRAAGIVYADYNLFYGNTTNKVGTIGGGTHDVTGDPFFVDPAHDDYHIGADSAAVDTGIGVGVTTDFDGNTRPQGIGIDMGYDEVLQRCSLSPNTNYAFSNPAVTLNFAVMGNVNCAAAVYFPRAAPHATGTVGHGVGADHFWQIAARDAAGQPAIGFTASVTAPYSGFTNPLLCFYPGVLGGAGWDCTGTQTYDASTVTRQGIIHFSNWAVGNDVDPTAVTLHSVAARVENHPIGFPIWWAAILGTVGLFLMWRRARQAR